MGKPGRKCYGWEIGIIHIGTCCDYWEDDGLCVCTPVDAAAYDPFSEIYCAASMGSRSRPNIKVYFNGEFGWQADGQSDHISMWMSVQGNGWRGTVRFDACDGSRVLYSKTTTFDSPPDKIIEIKNESATPSSAATGETVKCDFGLTNNSMYQRLAWWQISELVGGVETVLKSGEFEMVPLYSMLVSKTLTMPYRNLGLVIRAGFVDYGPIYPETDATELPIIMHTEPPTVIIDVRVVDQNYAVVAGSQVTIPEALGATTIATNMMGVAVGFTLTEGATFTATAAPPSGYTSDSGSTGSDVASGSMTITRTLTKIPIVPICTLSADMVLPTLIPITIPEPGIPEPGVLPSPPEIPPLLGSIGIVQLSCEPAITIDEFNALFPLRAYLYVLNVLDTDTWVAYIDVPAFGPGQFDLVDIIISLLNSGQINVDMHGESIPIRIRYPCEVNSETGAVTEYCDLTDEIPLEISFFGPIICLPDIDLLALPTVPLTFPALGDPGLPSLDPSATSLPIEMTLAVPPCLRNSAEMADPIGLFPVPVEVYLIDMVTPFATLSVPLEGGFNYDIITFIRDILTRMPPEITPDTDEIHVKIRYPRSLEFPASPDVPVPYAEIEGDIPITESFLEPVLPIICIPSIPADDFKYPPTIQLSPVEVSDPVTFEASISCTQDGKPVTPLFSFDAEFFIGEYQATDITVYAGSNTITAAQLTGYIIAAMSAGKITLDMLSFQIILEYPTKITDGIPGDYVEIKKTIDIGVPGPVICIPSIPSDTVTHPPNIQLSPPLIEGGLPTLDPVSDPVTFDAFMSCSQDGVDVGATFPFYAVFYVTSTDEEDKAADIPVYSGSNRITIADLTAYINAAIARGDITLDTTSFNIYLVYPTRIEDGVPGEYTTIAKTINITPPGVPPAPIVCNITNVTEKEPLVVTISELGIPTVDPCDIDVQLYITPPCGKSMADILAVTGSYLSLNHADGTYFASIPLNIYGEGVLDIASYARNWLLTLTEIPTSLDLVLVCPTKVTFSTPVAEYEDVPITVGIQVTGPPPPPVCEITDADFFTCPDGTVIQLNECVEGVKVPIVPTPTCPPVVPPVVPPTVGRAMVMAISNIVPEGRTVDVVVQALCAGVESDGEDATLLVDDAAVMTRPTAAGEVTFRWTAVEIGTRVVCVSIPASEICPYPGAVCRSIKVVTYLPEVKEQVEMELSEYETELAKLRKIREIERERLRGVAVSQGTVRIPSSLAGSTVVIGGIPRVVPPEGISVTVPAGESIVTIIREGVRDVVPVLILPGETETLPWGP